MSASGAEERSSSLRGGASIRCKADFFIQTISSNSRYNHLVKRLKPILATLVVIVCTGCGVNIATESAPPVLPDFITVTLPPTSVPLPTATSLPPTPIPTNAPIEGTTNTQVNVRAETNTASPSYGVILAFSPVQVVGKDATGTWYRILYAESPTGAGWVRADFIQMNAPAEIQVTELGTGGGSGVTGLVISGINVRSGPGTDFESLGVLTPKDVVLVTGKDSSGVWIQIAFSSAPGGNGWVSSEYLQVSSADALPVIGVEAAATEPPASETDQPAAQSSTTAMPDGDSKDSPITQGVLSPSALRAIQVQGDVSAPEGDTEDWVAFSTTGAKVVAQAVCDGAGVQLSLWEIGNVLERVTLSCGSSRIFEVTPNQNYQIQITTPSTTGYTKYIFSIEAAQQRKKAGSQYPPTNVSLVKHLYLFVQNQFFWYI